jgi:hypothetical protein
VPPPSTDIRKWWEDGEGNKNKVKRERWLINSIGLPKADKTQVNTQNPFEEDLSNSHLTDGSLI